MLERPTRGVAADFLSQSTLLEVFVIVNAVDDVPAGSYRYDPQRNGLELISALLSQNVIGEATRYGFGSALAVIMMVISSVFITIYLRTVFREERT